MRSDRQPCATGDPTADKYFAADGARLRYRDAGRGPAVMMIHGWTLDLEMWQPQVPALHDAFRVVRLDRRGFGLSTGRPAVRQDIADIGALCAYLDIRRIALVGMSQGARAAFPRGAIKESASCALIPAAQAEFGRLEFQGAVFPGFA